MSYNRFGIKLNGKPAKEKKPPKFKKPQKPIAHYSKKRQKKQRIYAKIVAEMASKDNECEIKSPVCSFFMTGANHRQKRSPNNLIVRENLERSCNPCNGYCETHPEWAEQNGHQVSRFKPSVLIASNDNGMTIIEKG